MRRTLLISMLLIFIGAVLSFMLADRRPPHEYVDADIIPDKVMPGEPMTLVFVVLRRRDCPGITRRFLTLSNGDIYIYDAVPAAVGSQITYGQDALKSNSDGGKVGHIIREFYLPKDRDDRKVPRGTTTYNAEVHYYCNFLQQVLRFPIVVRPPSLTFEIIDP